MPDLAGIDARRDNEAIVCSSLPKVRRNPAPHIGRVFWPWVTLDPQREEVIRHIRIQLTSHKMRERERIEEERKIRRSVFVAPGQNEEKRKAARSRQGRDQRARPLIPACDEGAFKWTKLGAPRPHLHVLGLLVLKSVIGGLKGPL
jgi:hypothetical protein